MAARPTGRVPKSRMGLRGGTRPSVAVAAVAGLVGLVGLVGLGAPVSAAEPWPRQVDATYSIAFNGIEIGKFDFRADVTGSDYTATGDARLSALFGAFKWQGATRASGGLEVLSPKPAGYTFDFDGTGKSGAIKMGFRAGSVANVSIVPPRPPQPGTIPVREQHLKDVLDPLSAVLALSRSANPNPCGRRLALFDGVARFDLVLTYLRQERVAEARPSGQPGIAYVCRVRYLPIAGHRASEETRHMASTDGIELALRPVPSADLFVPYRITIPTMAGSATLTSERITIATRNAQIALTR